MRVLFVCQENQLRSPTAEAIYRDDPRVSVRSAGVSSSVARRISAADVEWAEIIFVMEAAHFHKLRRQFPHISSICRVVILSIPDRYDYKDPELISILKSKVEPYLDGVLRVHVQGER